MEVRDYLAVVRRRWLSILLVMLVVVGAAAAFTLTQTPAYSSSARLFVATADVDESQVLQGGQFSAQRVKSYADLIDSRALADRVIDDLDLEVAPEVLSRKATAQVSADTVNLTITVTDPAPAQAQAMAQSYAENLAALVAELETRSDSEAPPVKATIVDDASFDDDPVSPDVVRNLGLALVLGLLLGFGLAVLREVLDTRIRSTEDLTELLDVPTLGVIGFDPQEPRTHLITEIPPHAPRAEAFRVLRTNLQFVDVDSPHRAFVVTSAIAEEGKTATSVNLALSLARAGTRTLLVECDLRRPKVMHRLGMDGAIGVTNVLLGKVPLQEAIQTYGDTGLSVLAGGPIPPNPAELLQTQAMANVMRTLQEQFDVVIIDAPPLLPVTDAALLAANADGAILVARHGKVSRDQVAHAAERLANVGARLVGAVVSCAPQNGAKYGYGYGYGYGYEPDVDEATRQPERKPSGRRVRR